MKSLKSKVKPNIVSVILIMIALIAFVATAGMLIYFRRNIAVASALNSENNVEYTKEYAFITNNTTDDSWTPVYRSMKAYADKEGVYIQWIGTDITGDNSKEELLEIATDASVDGIIIEADETDELIAKIDNAIKAGIPVITVGNDSPYSKRNSYVGVSYYNMGQEYGSLILEAVDGILKNKANEKQHEKNSEKSTEEEEESESEISVLVLLDKNLPSTSQNTMLMAMQEQLAKAELDEDVVSISPLTIENDSDFSAEESIQDILKSPNPADIIICLNEVNTVSVYQALVEQNKVGDTVIIGYSNNDTILNAIKKNIIFATITVDVEQMGKYCVQSLDEYIEFGRVSDYYSVNFTTINSNNLGQYLRSEARYEN